MKILYALIMAVFVSTNIVAAEHKFDMTIEEGEVVLTPNLTAKVWGFNGQVPGPLIHVKEGDELEILVQNNTSLHHTVHWHGVLQTGTWKMDGVPNVTQEAIQPGESFTYKFTVDRPGTLWYHCHVNVAEHVGIRGMWGMLIVDPEQPTELEKQVTKEVIVAFSGWDSNYAGEYGKGGHPRDKLDYWTINGKPFPFNAPLRVKEGDVLRMRLLSVSGPTAYHLHGHDMLVTHKDGLPLDNPYWADVVPIMEGERYDVIVKMDNPGRWLNHDHIEHHTSNSGKMPGGSVMIIEYEGFEKEDWYVWKDHPGEPDYFMSESMQKPHGMHDIAFYKTKSPEKSTKKRRKKKKQ